MRQRQLFAQAALNNGFTFTGGQMWTLLAETKHRADNNTEATPSTIDPNYTVGFTFARRTDCASPRPSPTTKLSSRCRSETREATVTTHGNQANFLVGSAGAGGGLYNGTHHLPPPTAQLSRRLVLRRRAILSIPRPISSRNSRWIRALGTTRSSGCAAGSATTCPLRRLRRWHDLRRTDRGQCFGRVQLVEKRRRLWRECAVDPRRISV